jgi:valacyclovir hydrolase
MPFFYHHERRLFYREQGTGPLLLILPGNTASSASHAGELEYFSQNYRSVALDFFGTGESGRVAVWAESWWEDAAADAAALMEHLQAAPARLIGCSGGAMLALLTAALFSDVVLSVVADSEVEYFPLEWMQRLLAERTRRTPGQVRFWQAAHGTDWEQVVAADSAMLLKTAQDGGDLLRGRLRQVQCPVLFTASLSDSLLYDVGTQVNHMAAQVPGSQALLVNTGNHPLMWSCPEIFRQAASRFLAHASSAG